MSAIGRFRAARLFGGDCRGDRTLGAGPHLALLATARAAFAEADVDRAYELSINLPLMFDRCALLLRRARDMGTLSAAQAAISLLSDALSEEDRKRLDQHLVLGRIRDSLTQLSAVAAVEAPEAAVAADIPTDWIEWLRRLTAPEPWKAAVSVAETAAREWTLDSLLENPSDVQKIADLLSRRGPNGGRPRFRTSDFSLNSLSNPQRTQG